MTPFSVYFLCVLIRIKFKLWNISVYSSQNSLSVVGTAWVNCRYHGHWVSALSKTILITVCYHTNIYNLSIDIPCSWVLKLRTKFLPRDFGYRRGVGDYVRMLPKFLICCNELCQLTPVAGKRREYCIGRSRKLQAKFIIQAKIVLCAS